jgi:hypothetical protein
VGDVVAVDTLQSKARAELASDFGPAIWPNPRTSRGHGLKTLGLVARRCQNAGVIAHYLAGRPEVLRVSFSGLASSPSHVLIALPPTTHPPLTAKEQDPRGIESERMHPSVGLAVGDLGAGLPVAR